VSFPANIRPPWLERIVQNPEFNEHPVHPEASQAPSPTPKKNGRSTNFCFFGARRTLRWSCGSTWSTWSSLSDSLSMLLANAWEDIKINISIETTII
jgi:hypothetical protein